VSIYPSIDSIERNFHFLYQVAASVIGIAHDAVRPVLSHLRDGNALLSRWPRDHRVEVLFVTRRIQTAEHGFSKLVVNVSDDAGHNSVVPNVMVQIVFCVADMAFCSRSWAMTIVYDDIGPMQGHSRRSPKRCPHRSSFLVSRIDSPDGSKEGNDDQIMEEVHLFENMDTKARQLLKIYIELGWKRLSDYDGKLSSTAYVAAAVFHPWKKC
jgi:hypothetical protein